VTRAQTTLFGPGKSRIDLITKGEDYSPSLTMDDAAGKTRVDLSITDGASSLDLSDKEGKVRAAFGSTGLESTKTGATEQTAESSLVLFDKEGKVIFRVPASKRRCAPMGT